MWNQKDKRKGKGAYVCLHYITCFITAYITLHRVYMTEIPDTILCRNQGHRKAQTHNAQ